jgi:hypothetical protein
MLNNHTWGKHVVNGEEGKTLYSLAVAKTNQGTLLQHLFWKSCNKESNILNTIAFLCGS